MKKMSLAEAKNLNQICQLERDNFDYHNHWIMSDGHTVTICQQKIGEPVKQEISIPRHVFNGLLKRYNKKQKVRK